MTIEKSSLAEDDLIAIWCYTYETFGEAQADSYLDKLEAATLILARNPKIGKERDDLLAGLRLFTAESHLIAYRLTETGILIGRVLHQSRDLASQPLEAAFDPG